MYVAEIYGRETSSCLREEENARDEITALLRHCTHLIIIIIIIIIIITIRIYEYSHEYAHEAN